MGNFFEFSTNLIKAVSCTVVETTSVRTSWVFFLCKKREFQGILNYLFTIGLTTQ